jgi:FkbM family methyltransferase
LLSRIKHIIARHWSERGHYAGSRDWSMSIYNRLLIHLKSAPLPGRGRVRPVQPASLKGPPLAVRLASSDWYVLEEIFLNGEYEYVQRNLRDLRTIVDLGANVGMSVRLWQSLFPSARIVAVEPDADNLAIARRNVLPASDGLAPTLIQACVAGRAREVSLDRSGTAYAISMRDDNSGSGERVSALTLPEILGRGGFKPDEPIDLLKCDIEGAEAEVFADCASWIGRVQHIVIELHAPYTAEKFKADLAKAGANFRIDQELPKGDLHIMYLTNERAPA